MSTNQRELNRRLRILKHARECGNVALTCRYFGIGRSIFDAWKTRFDKGGLESLEKKKPIGKRWPNQLSDETVEKILHLRKTYHLGPERIMWYLERYHGTKICCNSVYRTLVRKLLRDNGDRINGMHTPLGRYLSCLPCCAHLTHKYICRRINVWLQSNRSDFVASSTTVVPISG
jgi:transposase